MSASAPGGARDAARSGGKKPQGSNGNIFSRMIKGIITFFRQVISELKKVVTPSRNEWATFVVVVIVFVLAIIAYVGVLDFLIGQLMFWAFAH